MAHFGQTKVIEYMIEYYKLHHASQSIGPNSNVWPSSMGQLLCWPNETEPSPVMRATQQGHVAIVKLTLQHATDFDEQNVSSMTALMFAAQRGHVEICRILIEHDIDMNVRISMDSTALLLTCKRGHVAVVQEMVSAELTVNCITQIVKVVPPSN